MEEKYFTPQIEDIRVDWEFELFHDNAWYKHKLRHPEETSDFLNGIYNKKFRVSYLTKEQIEAEGWGKGTGLADFERTTPILWSMKRDKDKNLVSIKYDFNTKELIISRGIQFIFIGECKDINTFRYICKLLNI